MAFPLSQAGREFGLGPRAVRAGLVELTRSGWAEVAWRGTAPPVVRLRLPEGRWVKAPLVLLRAEIPATCKVLLLRLALGPATAAELTAVLKLSRRHVLRLLAILKAAGIVRRTKRGREAAYTITESAKSAWEKDAFANLCANVTHLLRQCHKSSLQSSAPQSSLEEDSRGLEARPSLEGKEIINSHSEPHGSPASSVQLEEKLRELESELSRLKERAPECILRSLLAQARRSDSMVGNAVAAALYRRWEKYTPSVALAERLSELVPVRLPEWCQMLRACPTQEARFARAMAILEEAFEEARADAAQRVAGLEVRLERLEWELEWREAQAAKVTREGTRVVLEFVEAFGLWASLERIQRLWAGPFGGEAGPALDGGVEEIRRLILSGPDGCKRLREILAGGTLP